MCPDTKRTQATVCAFPNCTNTVWQDPDGSFSSYCGTTHKDAIALLTSPASVCKNCKQRPVYIANGRRLGYCGKRCASSTKTACGTFVITRRISALPTNPKVVAQCHTAGCTRPVFLGSDGSASQWCSQLHRSQALKDDGIEACLFCRKQPKAYLTAIPSDYCSRKCGQESSRFAPAILPIDNHYSGFKEVSQQFRDQWKHKTRIPNVVKVWRIIGEKALQDDFARYKLSVERKRTLPGGNSKRRWHGTVRQCRLGDDDGQSVLCQDTACSLCSIIKSSFRVAKFGQRTNFGRFGQGIYTSATSSKANDYVDGPRSSPFKAMLLNDVVLGNVKRLYANDPKLTQPPAGFDSVIGEPGNCLNYDEAIVYKNKAIRPLFLVVYQ
ncbi:hypothetical protein BC835DRAFT_308186 [Cytidiella melzeri]|nr:hypothetical protein BC835DRAFT_308186 [Cytidiella melzeri]